MQRSPSRGPRWRLVMAFARALGVASGLAGGLAAADDPPSDDRAGPLRRIEGHADFVWGVALSPDGKRLLTGGGAADRSAKVRDFATGLDERSLDVHGAARDVAFLPDGRRAL